MNHFEVSQQSALRCSDGQSPYSSRRRRGLVESYSVKSVLCGEGREANDREPGITLPKDAPPGKSPGGDRRRSVDDLDSWSFNLEKPGEPGYKGRRPGVR